MEDIKTTSSVKSDSISWKEAKAHGNGNLFKNHEKKGSIDSWRNKRGTGGVPGFFAMSEIKPFEPQFHDKYCQCKDAIMDATTHCCTVCNEYFDAMENKCLQSYRMIGV